MVVAQERYEHYSLPKEKSRVSRRPKRNFIPNKTKHSLTFLVLMVFATGMLISYYYSQVVISGYEIANLSKQIATLQQETDSLAEEVDSFNTLGRVEYVAINKLNMVKPDSKDIVVVRADLAADNNREDIAASGIDEPEDGTMQTAQEKRETGNSKVVQAFVNLIGMKGS